MRLQELTEISLLYEEKNMKNAIMKKVIGTIVVVVAILVVLIYNWNRNSTLLNVSKNNIDKIMITNGTNGNIIEIKGDYKDKICDEISLINKKKVKNIETTGWIYKLSFYEGEKVKSITIVSNEVVLVSDSRYRIEKEDGDKLINWIETASKNQ